MAVKGISTLMKFFGRKPGQSLPEFKAEVDELSDAEKEELISLASAELGA